MHASHSIYHIVFMNKKNLFVLFFIPLPEYQKYQKLEDYLIMPKCDITIINYLMDILGPVLFTDGTNLKLKFQNINYYPFYTESNWVSPLLLVTCLFFFIRHSFPMYFIILCILTECLFPNDGFYKYFDFFGSELDYRKDCQRTYIITVQ